MRRCLKPTLPLVVAVHLMSVAAMAATTGKKDIAELPIEDLLNIQVTSVSKIEESVTNAPGTVYVITADEIARLGLRDLKDILALVPGVDTNVSNDSDCGGARYPGWGADTRDSIYHTSARSTCFDVTRLGLPRRGRRLSGRAASGGTRRTARR